MPYSITCRAVEVEVNIHTYSVARALPLQSSATSTEIIYPRLFSFLLPFFFFFFMVMNLLYTVNFSREISPVCVIYSYNIVCTYLLHIHLFTSIRDVYNNKSIHIDSYALIIHVHYDTRWFFKRGVDSRRLGKGLANVMVITLYSGKKRLMSINVKR